MPPVKLAVYLVAAFLALSSLLIPPGTAAAPNSAPPVDPKCFYTEDGSCVPAPVLPDAARAQARPKAAAAETGPAVLVKRKADATPAKFRGTLESVGLGAAKGLLVPGWWRVPVPAGEATERLIERLLAMPDVEAVTEEVTYHALATPNDTYYAQQWGLAKVKAPGAWDRNWGSGSVWIVVVDTGINYYHADAPEDLLLGYNFVSDNGDPWDDEGHGTHVSGIAAGDANNGLGVAGLCDGCGLVAVKVLDASGSGTTTAVANGISYAALAGRQYGKRTIVNLSLGTTFDDGAVRAAVSYAQSLGALVIAAAGNGGAGPPDYPAAYPGVLAVSATDNGDAPASFSQFGHLAAPGVSILSTYDSGYAYASGTSMASPHASGAAGLVWSRYGGLTQAEVSSRLRRTADVPTGWDTRYGVGRLNVFKALGGEMGNARAVAGIKKNG